MMHPPHGTGQMTITPGGKLRLTMKKSSLKVTILEIGPELAAQKKAKCVVNRDLDKKHVKTWVRLIKRGMFRNYGVIYANGDGEFYDGQHRMSALIETGHTASFVILSGLDSVDMNMMVDSGRKRATSQRLKNIGYANAGLICTAIDEYLDVVEHWKGKVAMLMPDEVKHFIDTNPDLVTNAHRWAGMPIEGIPTKFLVAYQYLYTVLEPDKVDQFFFDLTTHGRGLEEGHPVLAFWAMRESPAVAEEDNDHKRNLWIKNGLIAAFEAYREGRTLDKIVPTNKVLPIKGIEALKPKDVGEPIIADDGSKDQSSADESESES